MPYTELSGFEQAAQTYNQINQAQTQRLQQQAQEQYYLDRIRLEEEQRAEARKEKEEQRYRQWTQGQAISRAMDTNARRGLVQEGIDADAAIAEQMHKAAIEMLPSDPQAGLELLEKASKMRQTVSASKTAEMNADSVRQERIGQLAGTVTNEDDYEFVKAAWSKLGFVPPAQYMQYNKATQIWLQSQAGLSKKVRESEMLDLKRAKFEADERQREFDNQLKTVKEQRQKDKELFNRERIERQYKTGRKVSGEELAELRKEFSGIDKFDDLDKESQINAIKEFDLIYRDIILNNPEMSAGEARELAKQDILDRVSDDGTYRPYKTTVTSSTQGLSEQDAKQKLGDRYKPGYRYWIEDGRIKGQKL